jgi:hypothetical protein
VNRCRSVGYLNPGVWIARQSATPASGQAPLTVIIQAANDNQAASANDNTPPLAATTTNDLLSIFALSQERTSNICEP